MASKRDLEEYQAKSIGLGGKEYNQIDEAKSTIEQLRERNKELESELLNLYRRIHGRDREAGF